MARGVGQAADRPAQGKYEPLAQRQQITTEKVTYVTGEWQGEIKVQLSPLACAYISSCWDVPKHSFNTNY